MTKLHGLNEQRAAKVVEIRKLVCDAESADGYRFAEHGPQDDIFCRAMFRHAFLRRLE